jgi:DUF4097 and DUF4098 domain-containing protein YvlB
VRNLMLGVVLLVTVAVVPLRARADEWNHNYSVNGKPEIVVDTNDGDVEITPGSSEQVSVRVTVRGSEIKEMNINGNQVGNRVEIKVHRPNHVCIGFCFQEIRIFVQVPRDSDLRLRSGDGNLRVQDVKGRMELDTNDGDMRLHGVEGVLHADTHDGNVDVSGKFDSLNLRTGDGNIDAEISASAAPQPGWMLRTGDGNMHLRLPDNFAADISAHSGDGSVRVDFPITVSGSQSEHTVRGKLNGGGLALDLQTGDGDIHVEKM